MTDRDTTARSAPITDSQPLYARPRVLVPVIVGTLIAVTLLTPETTVGRAGSAQLTTWSTAPQGARLFYELVRKLGWHVSRRDTATISTDPRTIHAMLAPTLPLRGGEVHELLEHARHGGALFIVLGDGRDLIADSLHVEHQSAGASPVIARADTADCGAHPAPRVPMLWPGTVAALYRLRWRQEPPEGVHVFLRVSSSGAIITTAPATRGTTARPAPPSSTVSDAIVGFPLGRGRIVIASDPDAVRNDALRVCQYGLDVPIVRALEYLRAVDDPSARQRDLFVVDEYHHGRGLQPGTLSIVVRYLGATSSGRLFAQLVAAGIVLLLALAPRMVVPREQGRIERRSPLEHVDALARAYERVQATRTVTARLVRGLLRRAHRTNAAGRTEPDEEFLARVEAATPALARQVALIRRALSAPVSRRELDDVGVALQQVESSLTRM